MSQSIGTSLASIRVPEILLPGQVYKLPSWPVINTGEEYACFSVKSDPYTKLLNFNPKDFCLEGGKIQQVEVNLALPFNEPTGKKEYILEAQRVINTGSQNNITGAQVGAAVGTKLFFEIGQSSGVLGAAAQRINSLWQLHFASATAMLTLFCLIGAMLLARRAFNFNIKINLKK